MIVKYGDFELDTATLPQAAIDYLLNHGFKQSLQEATAGSAKAVRDLAAACRAGGDGFDKAFVKWIKACDYAGKPGASFESDVEIVAEWTVARDLDERFAAISAGTVGTRGPSGPRAGETERRMAIIAERVIRNLHAKQGKKLPDAAGMKEYVKQYLDKYGDATRAKAEKEIAEEREAAESADLAI